MSLNSFAVSVLRQYNSIYMSTLVNFATSDFFPAQRFNSQTGKSIGCFDQVIENHPDTIDTDFRQAHMEILGQARGAGYWLWKPYCILKALEQSADGDVVMYADSACHFISSAAPLLVLPLQFDQDIIPFALDRLEGNWTKRDAFVRMACDDHGFEQTPQRLASFILARKSAQSLAFFKEYLVYCSDAAILTDLENTCGLPNYPGFQEHRHDQSVFSLLTKKWSLEVFRDPCQWGNSQIGAFSNSPYPQLIEHTRQRSPKQAKISHKIKRFFFPK